MAKGNDSKLVSTGKPQAKGAIWVAPLGSTIPTDATTDLDAAFKCLGYVSDEGLTESHETDSEEIKAWGGDAVLKVTTSYTESYKYTLIESMREEVLRHVYGEGAVSGTLDAGLVIKKSGKELPHLVFVCELKLQGGYIKRLVVPNGQVTEVGDVEYKDGEPIGYETTLSTYPDSDGFTSYEYFAKKL